MKVFIQPGCKSLYSVIKEKIETEITRLRNNVTFNSPYKEKRLGLRIFIRETRHFTWYK